MSAPFAAGLLDARRRVHPVEDRGLPDGRDDRVALDDELGALDRDRPTAARRVRLAEGHALELDATGAAVLLDDPDRGGEELELDALMLGIVDLGVMRAHLLARAPVDDGDLGAEAA